MANEEDRIEWGVEPPSRGRKARVYPWDAWARGLKKRPGEWGKLATFKSKSGARNAAARTARQEHMPDADYEVATGVESDGTSTLYGRFTDLDA